MTITEAADLNSYKLAVAARDTAALALYETELALHDAHQSQIDTWIAATSDRLHLAVARHIATENTLAALTRHSAMAA
jgi:hypothetical protein